MIAYSAGWSDSNTTGINDPFQADYSHGGGTFHATNAFVRCMETLNKSCPNSAGCFCKFKFLWYIMLDIRKGRSFRG